MTRKEHRYQKRCWRRRQQTYRQNARRVQEAVENVVTPPQSPQAPNDPPALHHQDASRQRKQGMKVRTKQRKQNERKIEKLRNQLESAKKRANMYRKRLSRMTAPDTPRTKTRKLLRNLHVTPAVRKTLIYHHALVTDMRIAYKSSDERGKRRLLTLTAGRLIRKSKCLKHHINKVGGTWTPLHTLPKDERLRRARRNSHHVGSDLRKAVVAYYNRDEISRVVAGKKSTITHNKIKMQKRLLNDNLTELYAKFVRQNNYKISYAAFCRLRPFWVRQPTDKDRDTCLCKIHENHELIIRAGISSGIVKTSGLTKPSEIVCDEKSRGCMYGICDKCKGETIDYDILKVVELNSGPEIEFQKWQQTTNNEGYKIVAKVTNSLPAESLMHEITNSTNRMKMHTFNMQHQHEAYANTIATLDENSCVLHIDYSENFSCGYAKEIQSAHFGGSHPQATLHTGVLYFKDDTISFTSISDSLEHGPIAVWKHLEPIHDLIKTQKNINTIHYFSDGPTTQYRQKHNFFLFSTRCPFTHATWNFFEAGHGKGAADGVGGALKRKADNLLRHGTDLPTPQRLYEELKKSKTGIKLFWVGRECIEKFRNSVKHLLDAQIPVPGTMKLHQVEKDGYGRILKRNLSKIPEHNEGCCHQAISFRMNVSVVKPGRAAQQPTPILQRMAELV
jgi:hypothetical protein